MLAVTGVRESCRIYLVVPSRADEASERRLGRILAGGTVSCALLGCDAQGRVDRSLAARLLARARECDVAFLFESDLEAAAELTADGVHIEGDLERYAAARHALGADAIIGADCGLSRHCAMELGERGADYVAFGDPRPVTGTHAGERQEDLISWWAELFEVPCVAWDVEDVEMAVTLARHGADCVAVHDASWNRAEAQADAFADLAEALAKTRTAA